jgi:hypothetical protein
MSGNRANSAAIQRRTSSNSPPPTSKLQTKPNYKQTPPQQYSPQQYSPPQYTPQQYSPQQYSPQPNPKLSFSDAIALITIRLGRVETFINNLPPLDQLEQYSSTSQPENNENMKIVDEAVFKNIVSRLEKIEQTNITPIQTQIPLTTTPIVNNEELQIFKEENSYLKEEMVSLKDDINYLKDEINELKNIILQLQNYTMTTNQKLCDIIFSNENDEKNISDELSRLLSQPETQLESEGLDECISASLNGIIINEVYVSENETQNLNINI